MSLLNTCLEFLKKEEFKRELKNITSPIIEVIIQELKPYFISFIFFLFVNFLFILGIFSYLLRKQKINI
jgi:hypothetical protein